MILGPFKDDILQEAADVKVRQQQIKEKRKVEQKERRDASRAAALEAKRTGGLEALVADAQVKQNQHENAKSFVQSSASHGVTDRSAKGNSVNTTDEPGLGFVQQGPCTCLAPCKMQV